jgi:trimeric autotransporter adhesin
MSRSDWNPGTQAWRRPWQRLGWPAAAGGAMLLAAAGLAIGLTPQWQAQTRAAADAARTARLAAADARRLASEPVLQAAPAWPAADRREARLQALLRLAREHGVAVQGLSQKAAPPDEGARLATPRATRTSGASGASGATEAAPQWLEVTLPVRAPYAALRRFLSAALAADPALALDAVRLARGEAGSGFVQAELVFALASAVGPHVGSSAGPSAGSSARSLTGSLAGASLEATVSASLAQGGRP